MACESRERRMATEERTADGAGSRLRAAEMHPGALQFVLEADAVRSIRAGRRPVEVACISGELWVTVEGDPDDHVLQAGEALPVGRRRLIVMTALGKSRVRVVPGGRAAGLAGPSAFATEGGRRWAVLGVAAAASFLTGPLRLHAGRLSAGPRTRRCSPQRRSGGAGSSARR
jgi:hypothetical protein